MIGQLRGALVDKRPNQVIVDAGGVGYQVQIPLSTFAGLGALHAEVTLLIHTHLREDQIALYGFLTAREKQCFEMLISTSGVGPNLALKILSGMNLDELVPAIRKGDVLQLKRIPGVGQKTAERIILELRDKLAVVEVAGARETGITLAGGVGCGVGARESGLRRTFGGKDARGSTRWGGREFRIASSRRSAKTGRRRDRERRASRPRRLTISPKTGLHG